MIWYIYQMINIIWINKIGIYKVHVLFQWIYLVKRKQNNFLRNSTGNNRITLTHGLFEQREKSDLDCEQFCRPLSLNLNWKKTGDGRCE
jgi:hypothetical protein